MRLVSVNHVSLGIDGFEENTGGESPMFFKDKSGHERPIPAVTLRDRVGRSKSAVADAFAFLQANTKEMAKLTIPAPTNLRVPPYRFVRDDLILIGQDTGAA